MKGNKVFGKRVCKYCNRKFSNGRALGGHIRTHYNTTKFSTNKTQRRDSPSPPPHTTRSCNLSGWKVHRKRGSNQVERSNLRSIIRDKEVIEFEANNIEKSQEKITSDQEYSSSTDGDDKVFSMMESLKLESGSSDSNHNISRTRDKRFMCLTCNMVFPTFHAVRCHVYQGLNSSPTVSADDDEDAEEEAHKFGGEECGNSSSDLINEAVVTSNPTRMPDFDLNELPRMEAEE